MSSHTARTAPSLSSAGAGKLGNPWARLIAPCSLASRVIPRITDSVNPWVRWAVFTIGCLPASQDRRLTVQLHRHSGSSPHLARYGDRAAPGFDQSLADGEPQARAARRGREARLEDAREVLRRNALPVVGHHDPDAVACSLADFEGDARGPRVPRVLHQVHQYFLEL